MVVWLASPFLVLLAYGALISTLVLYREMDRNRDLVLIHIWALIPTVVLKWGMDRS